MKAIESTFFEEGNKKNDHHRDRRKQDVDDHHFDDEHQQQIQILPLRKTLSFGSSSTSTTSTTSTSSTTSTLTATRVILYMCCLFGNYMIGHYHSTHAFFTIQTQSRTRSNVNAYSNAYFNAYSNARNSNSNSNSNWNSNGGRNTNVALSGMSRLTRTHHNRQSTSTSTSIQSSTASTDSFTSSSNNDTGENGSAAESNFNLGQWEEIHGNYVLRPQFNPKNYNNDNNDNDSQSQSQSTSTSSSSSPPPPRALIHFLGGAIVGAAPDITYRYMLEKLAQNGFLIVSTPFTLSFDYITTCDDIITRFERIAPSLAKEYGPIPVIGVGHSCGSLLHLLITTLFPDTPRAANVLISYNNMNVNDAVPLFDEVVAPLFTQLGQNGTGTMMLEPFMTTDYPSSSVEVLNLSIDLGRTILQGNVPTDEALTNIMKKTTPKPFSSILPNDIIVPSVIRESIEQVLLDPLSKAKSDAGIYPLFQQSLDVLEQIPNLIQEVADGAREFNPSPQSVRAAARRAYRARRTLIIQYDNDPIDESEEIENLLKEAETVMKNKRPMVDFDVKRVMIKGGHATPCIAPPLDIATKVEDAVGEDLAKDKLLYKGADETVDEVVKWLEEGDL